MGKTKDDNARVMVRWLCQAQTATAMNQPRSAKGPAWNVPRWPGPWALFLQCRLGHWVSSDERSTPVTGSLKSCYDSTSPTRSLLTDGGHVNSTPDSLTSRAPPMLCRSPCSGDDDTTPRLSITPASAHRSTPAHSKPNALTSFPLEISALSCASHVN